MAINAQTMHQWKITDKQTNKKENQGSLVAWDLRSNSKEADYLKYRKQNEYANTEKHDKQRNRKGSYCTRDFMHGIFVIVRQDNITKKIVIASEKLSTSLNYSRRLGINYLVRTQNFPKK